VLIVDRGLDRTKWQDGRDVDYWEARDAFRDAVVP